MWRWNWTRLYREKLYVADMNPQSTIYIAMKYASWRLETLPTGLFFNNLFN